MTLAAVSFDADQGEVDGARLQAARDEIVMEFQGRFTPFRGLCALLVVTALGACGTVDTAQGDGVSGPVLRHSGGFSGDGEDAQVRGVIQIEGECLYLAFEDGGERYPVVWPASTTWNENDGHVVLPNGESVGNGDQIDGGGGYHDIDDVKRTAGQAAADLAAQCVDNQYGEIAVVNNQRDGVRRVERLESADQAEDTAEPGGDVVDATGPAGEWFVDELIVNGVMVDLNTVRPLTVVVDGEAITGTASCNQYAGVIDWSADGGFGRFVVSELNLTKIGCEGPVMKVEKAFIQALQSVDSYEAADGLYVAEADAATGFHLIRVN